MTSSVLHSRPPGGKPAIPPLRNGDHINRDEFERRYELMPGVNKAELIEGVVYMPSPVHLRKQATPHQHLALWIGTYQAATPGSAAADNATVRLDADNQPQPDVVLPRQGEVRWFDLQADRYELLIQHEGVLRSRRFPGLWLNVPARSRSGWRFRIVRLEPVLAWAKPVDLGRFATDQIGKVGDRFSFLFPAR